MQARSHSLENFHTLMGKLSVMLKRKQLLLRFSVICTIVAPLNVCRNKRADANIL